MAAPTFPDAVNLAEGTGNRNFTAVTTQAGDYLVVEVVGEDAALANVTPSVTGLTFTKQNDIGSSNHTRVQHWTAPDASGASRTVAMTASVSGRNYRARLTVVRGSTGPGTGKATSGTTQTVSVAREGNNSAMFYAIGDWSTGAVGTPVWTPGGSTTASQQGSAATYIFGRWDDSGTAATASHGISSPSYGTPSIAVLEMLGTVGGSTVAGTATAPFAFGSTAAGQRAVTGSAARAITAGTAAAGRRTTFGTATCATTAGTAAAGTRTTFGSATATTTAATAATGVRLALGSAAHATAFATAAAGQRTVLGTAARATSFLATAAGAGAAETVTGTATAPLAFAASAVGDRTVFGTADRAVALDAPAAGLRAVAGSAARATQFAATTSGTRTTAGAAAAAFTFAATAAGPADGIVRRPDTGTTARPSTGTITRPFTGTTTRP